ncbi:MAG TPA: AraC family transcriptional regulator [Candidatus Eremiobacteraceae bacterium]
MEQQMWTRLGGASEMQFSIRASSAGRSWNGIEAAIFDTTGGLVERPRAARHTISMHIGVPVRAACRCDGPVHNRLQSPGDIDVVPLGYAAAWEDAGPTTMLSINLSPSLIRSAAEAMGLNPDSISIAPQLGLKDEKLRHIGWALKAELESGEPFDRLYAESLGTAMAVHLLRHYTLEAPKTTRLGLTRRQHNDVVDYVTAHLTSNLSLGELAAVAGASISHFSSLFKQSSGLPVHQYVIRRRVECALNLLLHGASTLSEVAVQAGFADQSHMARCMRRVIGMTPMDVLRQL